MNIFVPTKDRCSKQWVVLGVAKSHLLAFVLQQLHVEQELFFQKPLDHISLQPVPAEGQKSHTNKQPLFPPSSISRKEIKFQMKII